MNISKFELDDDRFIKYLNECFEYHPESGEFKWKVRPRSHFKRDGDHAGFNTAYAGKQAGSIGGNGYVGVGLLGKRMQVHRLIWLIVYGEEPKCIDHINGNRTDQRISNLRNVSVEENNRNRASVKGKKNGCTGVYWCHTHQRYRARIKVNGKNIHIGYFNTINEAREERKKAELANGFHPNHGRASEVIHHERS